MKIDCCQHRKTMELLGLRTRLEKGIPDPKEREEVEKRIEALERELEMD